MNRPTKHDTDAIADRLCHAADQLRSAARHRPDLMPDTLPEEDATTVFAIPPVMHDELIELAWRITRAIDYHDDATLDRVARQFRSLVAQCREDR